MLIIICFLLHIIIIASFANNFQECGIRYQVNRYEPVILKGRRTVHSEYPWHVALYKQSNTTSLPEYICGGSIVHPRVVLTAAHCVYSETFLRIDDAKFTVVAGKYNSSWHHVEPKEQRMEVTEITMPQTYLGFRNRFADDIALLTLKDSMVFSSVIMPVCIDWNLEFYFNQSTVYGTVVGWGLTENGSMSDVLLVTKLKYYSFEDCRDKVSEGFSHFVTSDKFCAGLDNGTAVDHGDSGGGMTFPLNITDNEERYYLYGIVSTKDKWMTNIAAFTDLKQHLSWLNRTLLSIIDPTKIDSCPALNSNSVTLVNCDMNGTSVDCNNYAKIGTKGTLQCKNSYHSGSPFQLYKETQCSENKTWLPFLESCIDCGKKYRFNSILPLVRYTPRTVSEYPWHIAFYKKDDTEKKYEYLCGGTIIHPRAVLTAAHCIFPSYPIANLFIAAGKYKSNWSEENSFEQRIQVMNVYKHPHYIARNRSYQFANDIAILELQKEINISDYIMPVCMDWAGKLNLYKNPLIFGTVPGWGLTEDDNPSDELRTAKIPIVDKKKCQELLQKNNRYINVGNFCAGLSHGEAVSQGDSGGGLTFPKYNSETGEETHYLYGITSTEVSPIYYITLFTNVSYHLEWIKKVLTTIILRY